MFLLNFGLIKSFTLDDLGKGEKIKLYNLKEFYKFK